MEPVKIFEALKKTVFTPLLTYLPLAVGFLVFFLFGLLPARSQLQDQTSCKPNVPSRERKLRSCSPRKPQSAKKKSSDPTEKWRGGANPAPPWAPVGNFTATVCSEDDPGGISGSSSSSEANKENSSPGRLSRRQRKNRVRKEDSSPLKRKQKKDKKKWSEEPSVVKQYRKLGMAETMVYHILRNYTLSQEDMMALGYPIESRLYPGRAMIFKNASLDANAKEFVPREMGDSVYSSLIVQKSDQFNKKRHKPQVMKESKLLSEEKKCMRCSKSFFISSDGEYLTQEHCNYHWGKLMNLPSGGFYSCCKGRPDTKGCTTGKLHVWSGVEPGRNGPFEGYVRTRQRKNPPIDGNYGVYALDCEMCFTNTGLELTKISVVALNGYPVYETFVRPESFIIDYNTRFSGITAKDMSRTNKVKSLKDVQNDLMGFITADTILIGHGLENDLRALRMVHSSVIDTAIVFPHILGLPYKRSLKSLTQTYLRKEIQVGAHDSLEDASSCLELILWKLRKDLIRSNE